MDRGAPGGHAQQAARRVLSTGLRGESWALSGGAPPGVGRIAQKVVGLLERLVLGEGDDDGGLAAGADDDNLLVVVDDGVEDLGVVVVRFVVGHSLHGASAFRQRVPPPADGRVRVYVMVTGGLRGLGPCCAQGVSSGRARTFGAAPEPAARRRQRRGRSCRRRRGPQSRRRRVRSRFLAIGNGRARAVLHIRPEQAVGESAESCGNISTLNAGEILPCAERPLLHMGAHPLKIDVLERFPESCGKPGIRSRGRRSPMCNPPPQPVRVAGCASSAGSACRFRRFR